MNYPTINNYYNNDPAPAQKTIRCKQIYYISNPGSNTVNFGHRYIAETLLKFRFYPISNPAYSPPENNYKAHQVVQKGGVSNPITWDSEQPWFGKDFLDEYEAEQGYGIQSGVDQSVFFHKIDRAISLTAP